MAAFVERRKVTTDQLNKSIESSTHRWELIVFPGLFAFILLAAYGFYMVYSLANDVHFLAISVDSNMSVMSSNMQTMSDNMSILTSSVRQMDKTTQSINTNIEVLQNIDINMSTITNDMNVMTKRMTDISHSTAIMSHDFHDAGRPMSFFNSFAPW